MLLALGVESALAVQTRTVPLAGGTVLPAIWDLHQDQAGWIWIAGLSGLARYDGARPTRWGGDAARKEVVEILAVRRDRDGVEVVDVRQRDGSLVEVRAESTRPILDGDGRPLVGVEDAAEDGTGGLWVLRGGEVRRRAGTAWSAVPVGVREPAELWGAADGVWLAGGDRLAHHRLDGVEDRSVPLPDVTDLALDVAERAPTWAVDGEASVWHFSDGVPQRVADIGVWAFGVVADATGAWASTGDTLARIEGDRVVARVAVPEGIPNTGPLLLDREGSLWNGTFVGLDLRPQPGTLVWTAADGLPGTGTTWVAAAPPGADRLATVLSWEGAGVVNADGRAGRAEMAWLKWPICRDGRGHAWGFGARNPGETLIGLWRLPEAEPRLEVDRFGPAGCATAWDGGLWIGAADGIWHLDPEGVRRQVPWGRGTVWALVDSQEGELWAFEQGSACRADRGRLLAGDADWTCFPLPEGGLVRDAEEVDGQLWAVGEATGVLRWTGSAWDRLPAAVELPTDTVFSLTPARDGGVWLATVGAVLRVRADGDGWRVLERLDAWNGLPATSGAVADETADGTVWVATAEGVVRVPPSARGEPGIPAAPSLAVVRADGLPADDEVAVGWPRSHLELAATVPSYRDRTRLRWRFRLGSDQAWSVASPESTLRLVDLPPGDWGLQVQASLDGVRWSAGSLPLPIRVELPLVLRPPALAAWLALLASAAYGLHRLRLAAALRVERERTRIAMDLHDELGSGLGTLAVLAELGADAELDPEARREVSGATIETARSLGDALADIVWSLRRDAGAPATLGQQLADRGSRLFADPAVSFEADLPDRWPPERFALAVYRNVQLIAVEALMNASRHARARQVRLRLRPGRPWTLVVEDDGVGVSAPSDRLNTGTGLEAMRARAATIGARLVVSERPGGGTRVTLLFQPGGGGWWT